MDCTRTRACPSSALIERCQVGYTRLAVSTPALLLGPGAPQGLPRIDRKGTCCKWLKRIKISLYSGKGPIWAYLVLHELQQQARLRRAQFRPQGCRRGDSAQDSCTRGRGRADRLGPDRYPAPIAAANFPPS